MNKYLIIFTIAALIAIFAFFLYHKHRINPDSFSSDLRLEKTDYSNPKDSPSPTIMPFYEMTIPAMRERKYSAKLASLKKVYDKQKHTAYTTSYLSDNLKINGLITIPKGNSPPGGWPAVVFIHGYIPPNTYSTLTRYIDHVNYLAENGLVVFKIDLRGHGESEGEATGAYYSTDYVIDTLNAYAALESSEYVNKTKIGLWGHSMAGNVVLRAAAVKPDIPTIIVWAGAVYTYTDMAEYGIQDNSYRPPPSGTQSRRRRQEIVDTHGSPDLSQEFWKQFAPVDYLDDLKGYVQIHHAVDDNVVNIGYSRNLVEYLAKNNVGHKLYEYSGGGHNISGNFFQIAIQRSAEKLRDSE